MSGNIVDRVRGYVVKRSEVNPFDMVVEVEAADFSELVHEAADLQEANQGLREAREQLIAEIAALEDRLRNRRVPRIHVNQYKGDFYQVLRVTEVVDDGENIQVLVADGN